MRALIAASLCALGLSNSWCRAGDAPPLVHEAVVEGPVADVWDAFTTKKGAESWMVAHADIDLRIGGKMRTHYDARGKLGDSKTIENTILSFDPQRMLSIRNTKAPEGFAHADVFQKTWTVVYFEKMGANRTKVTIVGLGYGTDEASQKVRAHFDWGNAYTLKKLQKRFAAK
jgi:uncharacterized protein YndB with AHSA1/START domain